MRPALFLDRDGVINRESPEFIKSAAEWSPLPGSLEAIARLSRAGYEIVVVTNQSGVGRGLLGEEVLTEIHDEMRRRIDAVGGRLGGIFHCPHTAEMGCVCRKPLPGLVERACRELEIDAQGAPFIGDRISDLEAARNAGCSPILVRSGLGVPEGLDRSTWRDVPIHRDLAEAADSLLLAMKVENHGC